MSPERVPRLADPADVKNSPQKRAPRNPRRFTAERRARFLGHLEAGQTLEQACAEVGVSPATIGRWRRRAKLDPEGEAAAFAEQLDRARGLGAALHPRDLGTGELVRLLERRATERLCLRSIELLLTRPWEREDPPAQGRDEFSVLDELAGRREGRE